MGDAAKDDHAAQTLTEALAEAAATLKLPEVDAAIANGDILHTDLPLKIDFTVLRLRRDDPREDAFLAMLMKLEDDLSSYANEPMVFPVFGRGRVLEPLIGAGIHKANVIEHASYLCGACSCEVKEQNPGMDLLMSADWAPVDNTPRVDVVTIAPSPSPPKPSPTEGRYLAASAGALFLAAAGWVTLRGRRKG